ncbi:hypothetical protein B4O97_12660 [Marispirochaeta aestuarii]|uniref:Uncharacterized protein n=1 Tax=Marispirochaeta aestuarii TaxID=1963862 RepID=A0A1Y1RWD7_9SPIO|nr:hypothetical protein [Marispirochaeta aestuarii]ORC34487.1 hypothetical protein B4O97_12660 [Marispirochaeta aestuarii]
MKYSKLMRERIQRVNVLFKELGYEVFDNSGDEASYIAGFEGGDGAAGEFYIDMDNKFLEIAYTFAFPPETSEFLQRRLVEMLKICYEFGCYINISKEEEISFSVFSKIYFAGLNFYSLKETLKDFNLCIGAVKEAVDIHNENEDQEI